MKTVFQAIENDAAFMNKCKANPILNATFHALKGFVDEGGSLADLPWFSMTKFAERGNKVVQKAA